MTFLTGTKCKIYLRFNCKTRKNGVKICPGKIAVGGRGGGGCVRRLMVDVFIFFINHPDPVLEKQPSCWSSYILQYKTAVM